jgi:hypothetical protein
MAQVSSSPGVPKTLPTVAANSATPILAGNPILSTITNVWPAVLIEQGVMVPFSSSTGIQLPGHTGFQ